MCTDELLAFLAAFGLLSVCFMDLFLGVRHDNE
jgi:hypothetical protein